MADYSTTILSELALSEGTLPNTTTLSIFLISSNFCNFKDFMLLMSLRVKTLQLMLFFRPKRLRLGLSTNFSCLFGFCSLESS